MLIQPRIHSLFFLSGAFSVMLLACVSISVGASPQAQAPMPPASSTLTPQQAEMVELGRQGAAAANAGDLKAAERIYQQALDKATASHDDYAAGIFLYNLGDVCGRSSRFDKALDYHVRALALREKLGSLKDIGDSLMCTGSAYTNLGKFEKALDYHIRALAVYEKMGNPQDIGLCLMNLGQTYKNLYQFDKAAESYSRAVTLWDKFGDTNYSLLSLYGLSDAYQSSSQFSGALDVCSRILAIQEKLGVPKDIADSLNNVGSAYSGLSQYDKALDYYNRSLALRETIGNSQTISASLNNIGVVYLELSQFDKALDFHNRALALREKLTSQKDVADSLTNLGNVYSGMGQFDKSLDYHSRALVLSEKMDSPKDIAGSLNNLGGVYCDLGQYDKALDHHTRALAIKEKLGNPQDIAASLNNLGVVYGYLGQFDKALDYDSRALALLEKLGNPRLISGALTGLGNVYDSLGQIDKAFDYHNRALVLSEKVGSLKDIAGSLNNLGDVYSDLGKFDKALDYHSRALAIKEKLGNPQDIAFSLNNLGNVYNSLGQFDKALDHHNRALVIQEKIGHSQDIAGNYNNLGNDYNSLGKPDKALDYYNRALAIKEQLGNAQDIAMSLCNLGNVYNNLGQFDKAEALYARTLLKYEAVSHQVSDPSNVGAYQNTLLRFYQNYVRLLFNRQRPEEALVMAERGRAQGLARQLVRNGADFTHIFTPQEAQQLKDAARELSAAGHLLQTAQDKLSGCRADQKASFQQQKDTYQQRSDTAERAYALLQDSLFARYPQFQSEEGERPPTVADLKALARLNADTLYLEYAPVDDKTTLLFALSSKDGLHTFLLPMGEKSLAAQVRSWRQALTRSGGRGARPANEAGPAEDAPEQMQATALYKALLGDVEKSGRLAAGRYARLVVVGSGTVLDVPFAALADGQGKRLAERCALSSAISLGIFLWRANPVSPTRSLLCVGDPLGGQGSPRVIASRGGRFGPLRAAQEESKAVAALFTQPTLLVGSQAREAVLKSQMSRYALLHFATHGDLDLQDGMRSALILAPEPEGSQEDGVLQGREIVNLSLAAQMAVLSACHTGEGKQSGGEGLQGLAWAFRAAGCPSVVASQWQVDDAATKDLMVAFYRGLKAGKRKDEALQSAMLAVRKAKPDPYYWAAFQVVGDTAPLKLAGQ